MKVALVNPPFLNKYSRSSRSPAVTKSGTIYFPLWLSYAAGVLEKVGFEIRIFDAPAKCLDSNQTADIVAQFSPSLVICDTSTPSIKSDIAFCEQMKKAMPSCTVCLVGTHASVFSEEILSAHSFIDCIARHEYDYTVTELAEKIDGNLSFDDVMGLTFRRAGSIVMNADRPYIQNLDDLPFVSEVYKKHLDIEDYFYAHVNFPTISIFSSRGCPSNCFYCMYSQVMFGKCYRKRSAENLYKEMQYIAVNFSKVKEVLIDDDNFTVDEENVKQFCKLMIEGKNRLKWIVQSRVTIKLETMQLMKKAGCKLLVAGFESGNQDVLNNMKKGITLQQSLQFDKNARKAHLRVHGCFMAGNPGETKESLRQSLEFAKKLHLDTVQFFPLMLYPGTEAYDWAKKNDYIFAADFDEWLSADGMHNCVFSTENLSAKELVEFCDEARKKFYLRPKYILYKGVQSLVNKDDFVRTLKAFNIFKRYLFK